MIAALTSKGPPRRHRAAVWCRLLLAMTVLTIGCAPPGATECRIIQPPVQLPAGLEESSGVALSRLHAGVLWTHNDSGGDPEIFAIGEGGELLGRVTVTGAQLRDWEDLAVGDCEVGSCLYIADTGDNQARRKSVGIYRIPEPDPSASESAVATRNRATVVSRTVRSLEPNARTLVANRSTRTCVPSSALPRSENPVRRTESTPTSSDTATLTRTESPTATRPEAVGASISMRGGPESR